jgi:hypothetical protein
MAETNPRFRVDQPRSDFHDRSRQPLLPGLSPPELESQCVLCGSRGRVVGRRQATVIFTCVECEQVWELFDATGPPCSRCGTPTVLEAGRGPHFRAARCPSCGHHRWLKKPAKTAGKPA